jgi:hypothetical protein
MATAAPLTRLAEGVWLASEPVRIIGMRLSATMTVLELPRSELLLYSPVAMTPGRRAAVEELGTVTHLYAPNTYHHVWIGQWVEAFPAARVHAPAALRKQRPELRINRAHDVEPLRGLDATLDEVHIDGFALGESVLHHRPSGTLLVADLVHNIGRPTHTWTSLYSRAMGFYDRVAISRAIRWGAFRDHAAARRSVDRVLACSFDRLVVGHGAPIDGGAHEALVTAYEWLRPAPRALPTGVPTARHGFCG